MIDIFSMTAAQAETGLEALTELTVDSLQSEASLVSVPLMIVDEAREYWRETIESVGDGSLVLLAATEAGVLQGSVQLKLENRTGGTPRVEAVKLVVHTRARRRGIARELMREAEAVAKSLGCTMMTMETRKDNAGDNLCQSLGYTSYGEVPGNARGGDGELHTTVFYHRRIR